MDLPNRRTDADHHRRRRRRRRRSSRNATQSIQKRVEHASRVAASAEGTRDVWRNKRRRRVLLGRHAHAFGVESFRGCCDGPREKRPRRTPAERITRHSKLTDVRKDLSSADETRGRNSRRRSSPRHLESRRIPERVGYREVASTTPEDDYRSTRCEPSLLSSGFLPFLEISIQPFDQ